MARPCPGLRHLGHQVGGCRRSACQGWQGVPHRDGHQWSHGHRRHRRHQSCRDDPAQSLPRGRSAGRCPGLGASTADGSPRRRAPGSHRMRRSLHLAEPARASHHRGGPRRRRPPVQRRQGRMEVSVTQGPVDRVALQRTPDEGGRGDRVHAPQPRLHQGHVARTGAFTGARTITRRQAQEEGRRARQGVATAGDSRATRNPHQRWRPA